MDHANYRNVCALAPDENAKAKVQLLLNYLPEENIEEVPDPYYGTTADFQFVYDLLDRATASFISQLQKQTN
jgi:protein-tyrosine phosphatase